jgi:hypothetical protein
MSYTRIGFDYFPSDPETPVAHIQVQEIESDKFGRVLYVSTSDPSILGIGCAELCEVVGFAREIIQHWGHLYPKDDTPW